ncbi:MAG: cytochrome c biogenesis protein CcsA [Collinsella sp.]
MAPLVQGARLSEPAIIAGQVVTTKLLLSQKIFYLHVPVAVASFAAMAVAAFFAARFLATKDSAHDRASRTAMQVTLVFIIATMISGDVWTRFEWGVWWVWEPRLTTYFILMLLVIGYFILRNALDDPERSARFGAVFCIIAFIDAPISFFITRLVPSPCTLWCSETDQACRRRCSFRSCLGLFGMCMIAFALYPLCACGSIPPRMRWRS